MDGVWTPWREATVHALTHTLHYGYGVFEGVRAYKTEQGAAIFRLQDHTRRLFDSAAILGMEIPYTREQVDAAQCEAIRRNNLTSGYIRPLVYYGSESMGLHAEGLSVHMMIAAWSWGSYLGDEALKTGIRVKTASFARHHANVAMCKAKVCGNYTNSMLALQDVRSADCDEALLLDVDGYVSEGSGENIFIVRDGKIHTPAPDTALGGITRSTIMTLAHEMGYTVTERRITRDELYVADEVFMTGTAAEVTPVRELDQRVIGSGKRGPITGRLQSMYFEVVQGRVEHHHAWLSRV